MVATTQDATGHAEVDAQHGELTRVVTQVVLAVKRGDREAATEGLWEFEEALVEHFALEDQLMTAASHVHAEAHREAHARFLDEVRTSLATLQASGITPALQVWTEHRYASWFRYHIRANDQALVAAFRAAGEAKV